MRAAVVPAASAAVAASRTSWSSASSALSTTSCRNRGSPQSGTPDEPSHSLYGSGGIGRAGLSAGCSAAGRTCAATAVLGCTKPAKTASTKKACRTLRARFNSSPCCIDGCAPFTARKRN